MSAVESRHAAEWVERLKSDGVAMPEYKPDWRTRTLAWAAKRFGVAAVLPTLMGNEQKIPAICPAARQRRDGGHEDHPQPATGPGDDTMREYGGWCFGSAEGSIAPVNLRAAVLGANDGLVSTGLRVCRGLR
jgi:hypothetical protein